MDTRLHILQGVVALPGSFHSQQSTALQLVPGPGGQLQSGAGQGHRAQQGEHAVLVVRGGRRGPRRYGAVDRTQANGAQGVAAFE